MIRSLITYCWYVHKFNTLLSLLGGSLAARPCRFVELTQLLLIHLADLARFLLPLFVYLQELLTLLVLLEGGFDIFGFESFRSKEGDFVLVRYLLEKRVFQKLNGHSYLLVSLRFERRGFHL